MSLPFVELVIQHSAGDCGLATLAMYLGKPYEDVLLAAVSKKAPNPHIGGMMTRQIVRAAKRLGTRFILRRSWDIENDCGLLTVEKLERKPDEFAQHLVLLKWGLIFDTDGTVWEPDLYMTQHGFRPVSLLVEEDESE